MLACKAYREMAYARKGIRRPEMYVFILFKLVLVRFEWLKRVAKNLIGRSYELR